MAVHNAFMAFAPRSAAKVCCTATAAYTLGPAIVLVPSLAAEIKMAGSFDYRTYGTLLWWKCHLWANVTEINRTFHAVSLVPCWGLAERQSCEIPWTFIKSLQCKMFIDMSNTGAYDATSWKEVKCNKFGSCNVWELVASPSLPGGLLRPSTKSQ
jgi:hypothetical protein